MQETYNRIRSEISTLDAMIEKARTPAARERMANQRKALKTEAHELLQAIHKEQSAAKLEAQAAVSAAQLIEKAAYSASLAGVIADYLPRRVRLWLAHEAQRRKSGAKARKPGRFDFFLVVIGAKR